jgi:hypothetical protein
VISFLFNFVIDFFRFLMMLFLMLVSLFTGKPPPAPEAPPAPPPPMAPPQAPPDMSQFPAWAGGAIFWTAMILLLGYAAYIYFSGRGVTFSWLKALWRMLLVRWQLFRGAYHRWIETRLPATERNLDTTGSERIPLSRWKLGNMSDDQRVRYFYLTTIERAEQNGLTRRSGETPRQFAPRLVEQLTGKMEEPEAVQTLTEAFVRVRYSKTQVKSTETSTLQRIWERIRQHLIQP